MSKVEAVVGKDNSPDAEKLRILVAQDKAARVQRVKERIEQVLTEERCSMVPMMVLTAGNVTGRIEITALDYKPN